MFVFDNLIGFNADGIKMSMCFSDVVGSKYRIGRRLIIGNTAFTDVLAKTSTWDLIQYIIA